MYLLILLLSMPFLNAMELSTPHIQSTMHNDLKKFSARTNTLLYKLIGKLKKAENFKKPKWPIVLFTENDTVAKEFAIQMGHEFGRKPVELTPENVSDKEKIKEIKNDCQNNNFAKLYIIDNLIKFYHSFKDAHPHTNHKTVETELKNLLFALVTFNPLIVVESKSKQLPILIQDIFISPCHNFPKIIPFYYSGNYMKYQAITNWCKEHNIDCLYSLSPEETPHQFPEKTASQLITNQDEIIQILFSSFKQIEKLKLKDYTITLNNLVIENIHIQLPEVTESNKENTTIQTITYNAAINIDNLITLLKNIDTHSKQHQ